MIDRLNASSPDSVDNSHDRERAGEIRESSDQHLLVEKGSERNSESVPAENSSGTYGDQFFLGKNLRGDSSEASDDTQDNSTLEWSVKKNN